MNVINYYFVEGECEEKLINAYKVAPVSCFIPGKVQVFNFINNKITPNRLMVIEKNANIILVYDTDVLNNLVLKENIKLLNKYGFKKIYHIQSIKNFEDEIVRSTNLKSINNMYNTESIDEFKSKFIHDNDIRNKLKKIKFNVNKIWETECLENTFKDMYNKEYIYFVKKIK